MRKATPTIRLNDADFSFYNVSRSVAGSGGPNDIIRVTVTKDWNLLSPALWPFFGGGRVRVVVSSTMKNEPYPGT
jgi:hypothetical protein